MSETILNAGWLTESQARKILDDELAALKTTLDSPAEQLGARGFTPSLLELQYSVRSSLVALSYMHERHRMEIHRIHRDMRAAFLLMGTGFILASLINLPDLIRALGELWP